jgi:hypothetical protein
MTNYETSLQEWIEYILKNTARRYHFGTGKSFFTSFYETPKIFRKDILVRISSMRNDIDEKDIDNFDVLDAIEKSEELLER